MKNYYSASLNITGGCIKLTNKTEKQTFNVEIECGISEILTTLFLYQLLRGQRPLETKKLRVVSLESS